MPLRTVTPEMLVIYRKFNGNVDLWQRANMPGNDIITFDDWAAIELLLQELGTCKRASSSREYESGVRRRLRDMSATPEVALELEGIA